MRRTPSIILLVSIFFFGVLIIMYLKMYSDPSDALRTLKPTENRMSIPDSLLRVAEAAIDADDQDAFWSAHDELRNKYPHTTQAAEVSRLAANFDPDFPATAGLGRQEQNTETPGNVLPAPRQERRRPVRRNTNPRPAQPAANEDEVRLNLQLVEVEQAVPLSEFDFNRIMSRMRVVRSDRERITWYYHKNLSHYVYKNSFEAYIGHSDDGRTWLRLRIYYSNEEIPMGIRSFEVYADDRSYDILGRFGKIESGQGQAGYWEWFDMRVTPRELAIIQAVMNADRAALRYRGADRVVERSMTVPEQLRLVQVLEAYDALRRGSSSPSSTANVAN